MRRHHLVTWLGLLATIAACGGAEDGNGSCHDSSDCRGEEECSGPNDAPVCGMGPQRACMTDQDCFGDDNFCHAIGDMCSLNGIGSQCNAACTEGSCNVGFRCNASGACEALPCDEGFECPEHQACDMSSVANATTVYDRHNGCVNVSCSDDSQCTADLVCVNGFCQTGIGSCAVPELVP